MLVTGLLCACDDESDPMSSSAPPQSSDAAIEGEHDAAPESAPLLDPPAKGHGAQFRMTSELPPQSESERCQFVTTQEDLILNHDEIRFSAGSHHVLMFTTSYDEVPSENERGDAVDTTKGFDCSDGVQGFWSVTGLIAVSQSPNGQSAISFPEGVGVRIPAGSVLLINTHYINVAESKLKAEVYINLHTIPEDELTEEGGLLFWYNPFLKVPAGGESTMNASCPITADIHVTNLQSHMHRRGVGYRAAVIGSDGERSEIYSNDAWEEVPVKAFDPDLAVSAGSRIEWQCAYQNPEAHDVYQGPRSSDEMCMLIGSYYPRTDAIGFCSQRGAAFLGANWNIGKGSASCADSFNCVVAASSDNGSSGGAVAGMGAKALTSSITECLIASDPALVEPISDMLGCLASTPSDGDPFTACANEIKTCSEQ